MDKKRREAVIKEYLKAPEELTLRQAAELLDYSYRHVIRIREDLEARGLLIVDEDDATTIRKFSTQELGLPAEEVTKVLSSPAPKASKPSTSEPKAAAPAPTGDARYGVIVGNKKFPTAAKVTMTKAQACLKRDRLSRKHSVEVKVAENLHGGNRVVFDLDNALTVKVFAKFLDLTEAYISEDKSSAHVVFTTDEVLRTVHTRAGSDIKGDFLGNAAYQLRIEKSNKVYNGKEAIPLPLDEYHKFIALLKGDIRVEQVL